MSRASAAPRLSTLILLLGSITAVGPLSIDLYLPAFPDLVESLDTTEPSVQLTLTAIMVGLAVGQAISGPLSDAVGRRRPLVVGMAAYTLASALCALAPSVEALTAARFVQGLTGAAGLVVAQALVRDQVSGAMVARVLSLLMLVIGVAPILAPVLGGQLLIVTGWRGMFWVLAGFGAIMTAVVAAFVRETLPPSRRHAGGLRQALAGYRALFGDRRFMGFVLANALGFAVIFGYVSGSSFAYQDVYGVSPQLYGVLFGVNSIGLVVASQINGRLVLRVGPLLLLRRALLGTAAGAVALVVTTSTGLLGLAGLVLPLFVIMSSVGFVLPNAGALAMDRHPESAGTAAALLGTSQALSGALAGPLVGLGGAGTAVPMALVVTVGALGAATTVLVLSRRRTALTPVPDPTSVVFDRAPAALADEAA